MKKILFILLVITIVGCTSNKKESVSSEVVEYDCVLESDTLVLKLQYEAKVELPSDEMLRDSVIVYGLGEVDYKKSNKRILKNNANSWLAELSEMGGDNSHKISVAGEITYRDSTYLSYLHRIRWEDDWIIRYIYKGTIFDAKTGEVLSEEDLFGADYKRRVHKLLVKYATPLRNDTILPSYEDNLYNNDIIQPNGNFIFRDSTVMYIFHKYEIAYGAFGNVFIDIPKRELGVEN